MYGVWIEHHIHPEFDVKAVDGFVCHPKTGRVLDYTREMLPSVLAYMSESFRSCAFPGEMSPPTWSIREIPRPVLVSIAMRK